MKLAALWNKRQIPDIKVVPDWYIVLGRIDASYYDVTYRSEDFFVVKTQAAKSNAEPFYCSWRHLVKQPLSIAVIVTYK